jgi:hypothetical protein
LATRRSCASTASRSARACCAMSVSSTPGEVWGRDNVQTRLCGNTAAAPSSAVSARHAAVRSASRSCRRCAAPLAVHLLRCASPVRCHCAASD